MSLCVPPCTVYVSLVSFSTVFVLFCLQALRLLVPKSSIMEIKLKIAVLTHFEECIDFFFSSQIKNTKKVFFLSLLLVSCDINKFRRKVIYSQACATVSFKKLPSSLELLCGNCNLHIFDLSRNKSSETKAVRAARFF